MNIKRIAILGAGGLGAAYGSRFLDGPGFETQFIARGERLERLRRDGLIVNGRLLDPPVIDPDDAEVKTADLIIVALKQHHLAGALPDLDRFVGEQTIILSVMNGLDSEALIGARYGMEKTLYAIALGIDALREGNRIDYSAGGKIFFGEARNDPPSEKVKHVQEALDRAKIPNEVPDDMEHVMWRKFMINVGINQASAVLGAPYGVFQQDAGAQAIMESLMREAIAVANAEGVALSEADLQGWYDFLNTLSPHGKTSMLQDVEAGRKTEVELFGVKVVELGRKHSIPTSVNQTLAGIIQVWERI
ncbi:MAG: ketopantoate reductase family protein [Candidatus Promineifilaceae bacterium]|jgi:2-dehydropantoate 2-reductase